MMKTDEVIKKLGGGAGVARLLGITRSAVAQWGDVVPELREFQLRQRRPDLFAEGDSREDVPPERTPTSEAASA